jgi:outer membrane biosynthesis protein TonB
LEGAQVGAPGKSILIHETAAPESENPVQEEYLHEFETQFQETESVPYEIEADAEGDEEDDEGDLSLFLKDMLLESKQRDPASVTGHIALEVIKFRDDHVYDICFIDQKEKYHSENGKGRMCLAENKNSQACYVYFTKQFSGRICSGNAPDTEIVDLCISENIHHKRKKIYRSFVPEKGSVVLSDDYYSYLIRRVVRAKSPLVADSPRPKKRFHKNLLHSAGFHFVIMLLVALFVSLPQKHRQDPESRFVHIDTTKFTKPEPVKPQIKKVVKEKPVIKKAEKPLKVPAKKTASKAKTKTAAQKGNVKKRNIRQAGILGLIGTSTGIKPKEALASVTNLDTVSSSRVTEEHFRVAGIADKLDSPEIELPVGDMLKTRGSTQVLRSAGTKGEGRIAELNEGTAGRKGVKGMVSVELDNKVRIQGGMSREAVKRVIDQHMDEVTYCYENALMGNPSLAGSIIFEWKILLSGNVGEVGIKTSSVRSDSIHSCIKRAIKSWQFPKPKSTEVIVSYPFVFDIVGF